VKPQSAFVRTDCAVPLHTIAAVRSHTSLVVLPTDPKDDDAIGFGQMLEYLRFSVLRPIREEWNDRRRNFVHGLMEFWLAGVPANQSCHEIIESVVHGNLRVHSLLHCCEN
jgi:hypothetical protein